MLRLPRPVRLRNDRHARALTRRDAVKLAVLPLASRLELEITENLWLCDGAHVMSQLRELKRIGVAIVMDDLGAGYSSLTYLWRFPFDKIKLDRGFLAGLDEKSNAEIVVRAIVALGHALNVQVNVEGVETERQAEFVRAIDCDEVQGFYFSHAKPADEVAVDILKALQHSRLLRGPAKISPGKSALQMDESDLGADRLMAASRSLGRDALRRRRQ